MRIFITGGTGFVGSYLAKHMQQLGHEISALVRSPKSAARLPSGVSIVQGDPTQAGSWQQRVKDHEVIINLAGASIFTPWTSKARQLILESRILTTRNLVDALKGAPEGVALLSTSAVGYYGGRDDDHVLDESSPPGRDFLAEVGVKWEGEALRAKDFGVRVILPRFGIVLGKEGGALTRMVPAFKHYAGSALGSGKQWFPWIHEEDLFRIFLFLAERDDVNGPVNCVSPSPVTNGEFTRTLAKVLKKPLIMPAVPGLLLRTILGEFADVLLKGQRVVPRRLLALGFEFRFPTLEQALENLLMSD